MVQLFYISCDFFYLKNKNKITIDIYVYRLFGYFSFDIVSINKLTLISQSDTLSINKLTWISQSDSLSINKLTWISE